MAWNEFSGFQQTREKNCDLCVNQDKENHMNNSIVFDPGGMVDCFKNPHLVDKMIQENHRIENKCWWQVKHCNGFH